MIKLDNKGFTLVESLVVISLIGVIFTIIIPISYSLYTRGQNIVGAQSERAIIEAAKIYVSNRDNPLNLTCEDNSRGVRLQTLLDEGYLDSKLDDGIDLKNNFVKINYDCENNKYTYTLEGNYNWKGDDR